MVGVVLDGVWDVESNVRDVAGVVVSATYDIILLLLFICLLKYINTYGWCCIGWCLRCWK